MGRLIDADAFERKVMCGDEEDVQDVIYSLRDFPTAYDVDKVAEQLEKEKQTSTSAKTEAIIGMCGASANHYCGEEYAYQKAIEIVKGGGVDGN